MDNRELERIIYEEVQKALEQHPSLPAFTPLNYTDTVEGNNCQLSGCTIGNDSSEPSFTTRQPASSNQAQSAKPAPLPENEGPRVLALFSGANEAWETISQGFANWRDDHFILEAVYSSSAKEVLNMKEISQLGFREVSGKDEIRKMMYDMKRYAAVLLPSMSRTHAAKLALGITDSLTLNLSIAALAQGVPTFATNEGLDPTACIVCGNNVPGIQDMLDNYRNQLSKMGVRLGGAKETMDALYAVVRNKADSGPDLIKTLITEEDAAKLKGPVVKVARGGLVTPLAMEQFIKRGIEVQIVPQKD